MTEETNKRPLIGLWMGRPMSELTRDELLNVIEWCGQEIQHLRSDRDRWARSGDARAYLMDRDS